MWKTRFKELENRASYSKDDPVSSLGEFTFCFNYQIQFVKDQQAGIRDKLDLECFALEEEVNALRPEVSVHH